MPTPFGVPGTALIGGGYGRSFFPTLEDAGDDVAMKGASWPKHREPRPTRQGRGHDWPRVRRQAGSTHLLGESVEPRIARMSRCGDQQGGNECPHRFHPHANRWVRGSIRSMAPELQLSRNS
jgi:hypothetical protein